MGQYGIISYGVAVPYKRLKVDEIIELWRNVPLEEVTQAHGVQERGVLAQDEDSNTLALEAFKQSIKRNPKAGMVDAFYYGTCTNPYDSRPSSTLLLEATDLPYETQCADIQFSTKSGSAAIINATAMVGSGLSQMAAALGADTMNRHVAPGDLQEPYASCGAGAVIIGTQDVAATIDTIHSYSSDLSDHFRLEGERYIRRGMFDETSLLEVGVSAHSVPAGKAAMEKLNLTPADFTYGVFQQATPSMAYDIANQLGFTREQVEPSIFADMLGDTGSASTMIGLAKVLDKAKLGERILLVSYGFGAGSDALVLTVTNHITKLQDQVKTIDELLNDKDLVDYKYAMKYEFKYIRHTHPFNAYL